MGTYQASSPDELALVKAAAEIGVVFKQRHHSDILIEHQTAIATTYKESYKILTEFPFDSTRKCMSVLAEDQRTGRILLITKGADNVML